MNFGHHLSADKTWKETKKDPRSFFFLFVLKTGEEKISPPSGWVETVPLPHQAQALPGSPTPK